VFFSGVFVGPCSPGGTKILQSTRPLLRGSQDGGQWNVLTVVFPDGRVIERTPENNPEFYEGQPQAVRLNELLAAWTADNGIHSRST
jgi:hypothetical protein